MKAIVSLFISAYQPGLTSIECRPYSLNQSRQPLLCDDKYCDEHSEAGGYKNKVYDDWPNEELDRSENDSLGGLYFEGDCFEDLHFEDACFESRHLEDPSYEDTCWMISRARRRQPLGYYVMYLRYVSHHSGYAKTVAASLRQHIALHCTALHCTLI